MDCGPAALKSVLEGFRISGNYDKLRKACLTDVSGTSIDVIEDVAWQFGLDAEQVMIQNDHLLLPETKALPAIVVVRLATGFTHFVVAWKTYGKMIQIMDPAVGRIWMSHQKFLEMLYPYSYAVAPDIWKEYAKTDVFVQPLYRRMCDINISNAEINRLIDTAQNDDNWQAMAILDASVRILKTITSSTAVSSKSAEKILNTYYESQRNNPVETIIPDEYFSVVPLRFEKNVCTRLTVRGALLIHFSGKTENNSNTQQSEPSDTSQSEKSSINIPDNTVQPEKEFYHHMLADSRYFSIILLIALSMATFNISIEALILMGVMTVGTGITQNLDQQGITLLSVFIFFAAVLLIEWPINAAKLQIGRRFEISTRLKFLLKIPKLNDHYFHSRTNADIAQRIHDMRLIRKMPEILTTLFRQIFQIMITVLGIIWLMPSIPLLPVLIGLIAVFIPILALPFLKEKDLQLRVFTGSLSQFCLDALKGLTPLRCHSAENAIRYEQETILSRWKKSGVDYFLMKLSIIGAGVIVNTILSIILIYEYIQTAGNNNCILLLIFWVLNLSDLGIQLANSVGSYPGIRNRILRILEPIHMPEKTIESENNASDNGHIKESGMKIEFRNVSVRSGEQPILSDINIDIQPGEHVAIIGQSGAGKSSIMRVLLGFYDVTQGNVFIDNTSLHKKIEKIRKETAWIDPCVHIWNQTLFDNVVYGSTHKDHFRYGQILDQAGLIKILNNFPDRDETTLGEAGKLVSGGEGQRVRLGRGLYQNNCRCVILDEPFRGLSHQERHSLLHKALDYWRSSTLFFISHDILETTQFDRVLVVEKGKIIENGSPDQLLNNKYSHYKAFLDREKTAKQAFDKDNNVQWKKIWIEKGTLHCQQNDRCQYTGQ